MKYSVYPPLTYKKARNIKRQDDQSFSKTNRNSVWEHSDPNIGFKVYTFWYAKIEFFIKFK